MATEALHIFDPRRNFRLQGRGATARLHDASAAGVSMVRSPSQAAWVMFGRNSSATAALELLLNIEDRVAD